MKFDVERLAWWAQAAAVSQEQKDVWAAVSSMLINRGQIEELTKEGTIQAIDRLSYEIAMLSLKCFLQDPQGAAEGSEIQYDDETTAMVDKMDEILLTIAYGSKIHKDIIDLIISERVDFYVNKIVNEYESSR